MAETAQKTLEKEILDDGRKRADAILQKARTEADRILSTARDEAAAEAQKVRDEGNQRARKRADMILRTVSQEIARRQLLACEELVKEALDQAEQHLEKLSGNELRRVVRLLAIEAIHGMKTNAIILRVRSGDDSFDANALAAEVSAELKVEGNLVPVRAQNESGSSKGVIVASADGRMQWDNTFHARMRRLRGELRTLVAPILFEEV